MIGVIAAAIGVPARQNCETATAAAAEAKLAMAIVWIERRRSVWW